MCAWLLQITFRFLCSDETQKPKYAVGFIQGARVKKLRVCAFKPKLPPNEREQLKIKRMSMRLRRLEIQWQNEC